MLYMGYFSPVHAAHTKCNVQLGRMGWPTLHTLEHHSMFTSGRVHSSANKQDGFSHPTDSTAPFYVHLRKDALQCKQAGWVSPPQRLYSTILCSPQEGCTPVQTGRMGWHAPKTPAHHLPLLNLVLSPYPRGLVNAHAYALTMGAEAN